MGQASASVRELKKRLDAMREAGQAQWSGHKLRPTKRVAKLRGCRTVADLLVADRG